MLVLSEKVIVQSKAFKYPRYKNVFIDENPKTGFSDKKKHKQKTKKCKNVKNKK